LQDNEAIFNATKRGIPTLLLYVFEKSLKKWYSLHARHWNFIKQSIVDLNKQLKNLHNIGSFIWGDSSIQFSWRKL
jgi:deoxyribodipyrimidine photo-lyase